MENFAEFAHPYVREVYERYSRQMRYATVGYVYALCDLERSMRGNNAEEQQAFADKVNILREELILLGIDPATTGPLLALFRAAMHLNDVVQPAA